MAPTQSRIRPFSDSYQNIGNILVKNIHIPMDQRSYGWLGNHIDDFCNDLIKMFDDGEHIYTMGSMITYISDNIHHVYDGQHRLLTIAIVIIVLKRLLPEYGNSEPNIYTDGIMIEFTNKQREYNKTYKNIPKITCACEKDMIALLDISNDNIDHWTQYIKNIDDYIENKDCSDYTCNKCNDDKLYSHKSFMNHIKKKHNYQVSTESKLYDAYYNIYNFLINYKNNEIFLKELYIFIVKYTEFQFFEYYSHTYVCQKFNWENNRGKIPEHIDIIKSQILVNIPSDQQNIVYEKIQQYRNIYSPIYSKLGMNIIEISIQIYNKKITRKVDYNYEFKSIIESQDVYEGINNLFDIIEDVNKIYQVITENKYGRLLNNNKSVCLAWEGYKWCLLPILYTLCENKKSDKYTLGSDGEEIIEMFAKWYFRNTYFDNLTFNSVKYSETFIKISNKILSGDRCDYKEEILNCLVDVTKSKSKKEQYIAGLKEYSFKDNNKGKYLLMFLETSKNNDSITVPVPFDYTLEHIIPKKTDIVEINYIGNFTLLEGKNSKNGHKGNSSIGANDYVSKKNKSYMGSNSLITRELAEKYDDFTTESIIERSDLIAKELEEFTNYFPKPQ